ncbi:hypothetical protein NB706_003724 [Xanthomonas sacchari]|nr:hypothetical protein [Xanthomonas sacchari]
MRGIGDEAAFALQRGLQALHQSVDRGDQAEDLARHALQRQRFQPLRVALADRLRDPAQGTAGPAHHQPHQHHQHRQGQQQRQGRAQRDVLGQFLADIGLFAGLEPAPARRAQAEGAPAVAVQGDVGETGAQRRQLPGRPAVRAQQQMAIAVAHLEREFAFVGVPGAKRQRLAHALRLAMPAADHDGIAGRAQPRQIVQRLVDQAQQHARGLHQLGIEHLAGLLQPGAVAQQRGQREHRHHHAEQAAQQASPHRTHGAAVAAWVSSA